MKRTLLCEISHKSFGTPLKKEFHYEGETLSDIIDQIDTLPNHKHNLRHYGRTAFKSVDGVKHKWTLVEEITL